MAETLEFEENLLASLSSIVSDDAPVDFGEVEIEILPKGLHTSDSGYKLNVTDQDLDDLVSSYNPANFQAPLIVTHKTQGVDDRKLAESEFAYGVPDRLKRVGDKVKAVFSNIAPQFADWVKKGHLLSVSPSLYLPHAPSNPTPGKLALRHVAALGKTPPAIKGMEPLQAAFANFSGSDEGVVNFSFSADAQTIEFCDDDRIIARVFQSLRDWMISEHGLEVADRVIPAWDVGMLIEKAAEEDYEDDEEERMNFAELQEKEEALDRREAELQAREAKLRRSEFTNFCEAELRGKLTPALATKDEVADFMEFLHVSGAETSIEFSEEGEDKSATPLDWFKGFLQKLPTQVHFGEVAKNSPIDPATPIIQAGTFDASEVELDRKIRAYQAQHQVDYATAMSAIGVTY